MAITWLDAKRIRGLGGAAILASTGWTLGSSGSITSGTGITVSGTAQNFSSYDLGTTVPTSNYMVIDYDLTRGSGDHYDHPMLHLRNIAAQHSDVASAGDSKIMLMYWANGNTGDSNGGAVANASFYDTSRTELQVGDSSNGFVHPSGTTRYYRFYVSKAGDTLRTVRLSVWETDANRTAEGSSGRVMDVQNTTALGSNWLTSDDLRYLLVENKNGNQGNWTLSNLKIWNVQSTGVANNLLDDTPIKEFTFTDIPAVNEKASLVTDGWTVTDTASGTDFEHANNELQLKATNNAANSGSLAIHDMGANVVSSTEWILRWKWHIISRAGSGGSPQVLGFGLSSGSGVAGSAGSGGGTYSPAQGVAGIFASTESSQWYFQQFTGTTATNFYTGTDRNNTATDPDFTNATYYCQLRRYNNSGTDTIEAKLYSDSGYSSEVSSTGSTETSNMPANLRYIKAEAWQHSVNNQANNLDTIIDDVKFWNGTSTSGTPTYETDFTSIASAGPTENTIFEETDARKYFFLQNNTWVQET